MALHAHTLEVELPDGEVKTMNAPIPHDFDEAVNRIAES